MPTGNAGIFLFLYYIMVCNVHVSDLWCVKVFYVSKFELILNLRDRNFNMMVAILHCVCVGHCTVQTGSFYVKSSLYYLVMGCKMFHHKPVISVQSLKIIHLVTAYFNNE